MKDLLLLHKSKFKQHDFIDKEKCVCVEFVDMYIDDCSLFYIHLF